MQAYSTLGSHQTTVRRRDVLQLMTAGDAAPEAGGSVREHHPVLASWVHRILSGGRRSKRDQAALGRVAFRIPSPEEWYDAAAAGGGGGGAFEQPLNAPSLILAAVRDTEDDPNVLWRQAVQCFVAYVQTQCDAMQLREHNPPRRGGKGVAGGRDPPSTAVGGACTNHLHAWQAAWSWLGHSVHADGNNFRHPSTPLWVSLNALTACCENAAEVAEQACTLPPYMCLLFAGQCFWGSQMVQHLWLGLSSGGGAEVTDEGGGSCGPESVRHHISALTASFEDLIFGAIRSAVNAMSEDLQCFSLSFRGGSATQRSPLIGRVRTLMKTIDESMGPWAGTAMVSAVTSQALDCGLGPLAQVALGLTASSSSASTTHEMAQSLHNGALEIVQIVGKEMAQSMPNLNTVLHVAASMV